MKCVNEELIDKELLGVPISLSLNGAWHLFKLTRSPVKKNFFGTLTFLGMCFFAFPLLTYSSILGKSENLVVGKSNQNGLTPFPNDERTKKIFEQEQLIKEGSDLVEQEHYDEAIAKYQEAMRPDLLLHDYDVERPIFLMSKVLKFQGKFEDAFRHINEVLKKHPDVHEGNWHEEKLELDALIKTRDTQSPEPVYQYIQYLKEKYFSPKGFRGDAGLVVPTVIRLYDHIGDHDQGIAFVDEMKNYGLRQNKTIMNVKTAKEAWQKFQELRNKQDADWHEYKFLYEYLMIREAFEQDKVESFKGCLDAKSGDACMGRATKALIQSNYFPW